ncbi:MAG: sugar phosphate isomerase/epimerase family protein [Tannerellaceae bacterium]
MEINRRNFLKATLASTALAAGTFAQAADLNTIFSPQSKQKKNINNNGVLKISFQEGIAPGESLNEKLDYMENLGVVGLEPWGGGLPGRVSEIQKALQNRNIKVSAICAGFKGFLLSEDPAVRKECKDTMKEILAAAGELGSVGVILVPGFNGQKPALPHSMDTRKFLCDELAELGEYAVQNNTTVILEPLNRQEAFYLRQVGDAASICRDINSKGVTCMGDFWHMTFEEPCDMGAFISGGDKLSHVHVASRKRRSMPGEDGEADNYINGFKGLKLIGYDNYVSFECGSQGDKKTTVPAAVALLKEQWNKA